VGDDADGIPGVPRWGARSAAAVLARYHRLEAIPDQERHWGLAVRGASALAASLRAHRDEVMLYRTLATLRRDVPLAEDLEALLYRGSSRARLAQLETDLGISDLAQKARLL
jgi:5'-3' exonuclease